jgi:hypothetical protein
MRPPFSQHQPLPLQPNQQQQQLQQHPGYIQQQKQQQPPQGKTFHSFFCYF